jgi:hypothetical protein
LLNGHGISKGLIPIPKICGKPDRRYSRPFGRPLTVLKVEGSIRFVSLRGVDTRKCKSARVCVLKSPNPQHAWHDGKLLIVVVQETEQTKKNESK